MLEEKKYLIKILKVAGIKSKIYTSMKELKLTREIHLGAVIRNGESFVRNGSKTHYIDSNGVRVARKKLYDRETKLKVVIADADEDKCEELLATFFESLNKGLDVDSNWVDIEVSEIDWVEAEDSILKAKIAVEFVVTFKGGLYKDSKLVVGKVGNVQTN